LARDSCGRTLQLADLIGVRALAVQAKDKCAAALRAVVYPNRRA